MFDKALDILYQAKQSKIEIILNQEQLELKLPKNGKIEKALLDDIKNNKGLIVDLLKKISANSKPAGKITPVDRKPGDKTPLSFSQERLWFIDRMQGSVQYHMPIVLRLKGSLNTNALKNALNTIISRHEILKTVFLEDKGSGYQQVKDNDTCTLNEINGIQYKEDIVGLQLYIENLLKQPFDLSGDFMLRAHLIHLGPDENVLVVIIHHIAFDGWSRSVLVREFVELYSAFHEQRPAVLPELGIQYADFASWQRQSLAGGIFEKKLSYWRNKLEDVETLNLPTDFTRPAIQSTQGASVKSKVDIKLTQQLQELSRNRGTTLFMTLLTAFKILLHKYSGQHDICVGTPIAGRQQRELEALIGFFVNTLALRTNVRSQRSFNELLQEVRTVTLEAYENQEVPFEKIVDEVVKERSLNRNPLFQVMMVFMNTPDVPQLRLGDIKLSNESFLNDSSKFDIQLFITETSDGLTLLTEYCTDLFTSATIDRIIAHYKILLSSIVENPGQKIADLSMLTNDEEQHLLFALNNTGTVYPKGKSVNDLFEQQVIKTPDAVAVIFDETSFTYDELNKLSNRLAHYLNRKGVTRETLVAICLERSPQMIVGIWGILKAGAAYVPIDPTYPEDRIKYMLDDTAVNLIIANPGSRNKIAEIATAEIIDLDRDFSLIQDEPFSNLDLPIAQDQLAYVIYTSGSTGTPKGVMNEHGGLSNRLFWAQEYFNLTYDDAVLQKTTFCFDVSVWELVWPLTVGARLVFAKPGGQKDNSYIKSIIDSNEVSVLHFVPSMLAVFLPDINRGECTSLKKVLCSGEALKPSHVELFREKLPGVELHNLYGPTEAAIDVTCWTPGVKQGRVDKVPIGKPIANTSIYILDEDLNHAPLGGIGEIHIGGVQVARGYLNRAELTEQKFIKDPFENSSSSRLYKTGDLGRWMPDGNVEYLGRKDDQVKIRGYRIELGEIEAALQQIRLVNEAAVLFKTDKVDNTRLVCYYVPDHEAVKEKEKELYLDRIASWKDLYDKEYTKNGDENIDEEFDLAGWNSSFTGEAIPAGEMKEWVDDIVGIILSGKAENVLEIGCGTGLIYFPLAGRVNKYIGTDLSRASVEHLSETIRKGSRDYGSTELHVGAAHEVMLSKDECVDTIILNSIIQYFPGEEYLNRVIGKSISLLKGSGRIIIGDVRDKRLNELFQSRLQANKLQGSAKISDLKWAAGQKVLREEELTVSPEYFYRLKRVYPEIAHVDVQWKNVGFINELSLYRFTVIIYVGIESTSVNPDWQPVSGKSDRQHVLAKIEERVNTIALKDVLNPRLWKEKQLDGGMQNSNCNTVSDLLLAMANEDEQNAEIRDLLHTAKANGYHQTLYVNKDPLKVNVLLELEPSKIFIQQLFKDNDVTNQSPTNVPLFTDICLKLQKEMKAALMQRLPDYMVPSEMVALSHLPLNSSGKTDRKFLSERDEGSFKQLNYQAPETEVESKLAGIWQDLLHIEKVGIHDNFFELGGHSLLVVRLISAMRRELDVELSIKDIFVYPTIATLAAFLAGGSGAMLLPAIQVSARPSRIPLSFSQERLWFVDHLEGSVSFHIPIVLKLTGKLNPEALSYAFKSVVGRHEVLRTVFREEDGHPYQVVNTEENWAVNISDASRYKNDIGGLKRHIKKCISVPFDLSQDYTLRADLLVVGYEENVLVITLHHIASDAWSLGIIVQEVVELYKSYVEKRNAELPLLSIQYADYAIWQRNYLKKELLDQKLNYWKGKLNGVEPLQLPTDYPRPPVQSTKGTTTGFVIDKNITEKIRELSRRNDSTLFMTFVTAFKVLLHRYTGQQDICIGTSVAGRQQHEIENLIGVFVNILALRTYVDNDISFTGLLKKVRQTTLEAYEHQEVPFERVVDAVVKERDISRTPLFQILIVMLNTPDAPEISLGEITLTGIKYEQTSSKYDITLFLTETEQGISGSVEYSTELFSEQTIQRMVAQFNVLLASVTADPGQNVDLLPIITAREQNQLLVDFNNTNSLYPKDKTIVELFQEQVTKSPVAIALVFENERLTYQELNERSNQLGHYLKKRGVRENTLVVLSVERSIEMMVAILGILKAGGTYVPVDPGYPAERIEFMLEDTASDIIITTKKLRQGFGENHNIQIIELDAEWPLISEQSQNNISTSVGVDDLAYVIYTSGSTGKPKGVMVTQKNVVSLVKGVDYVSLTSDDILLSTGSSSFDATTIEYWGMLLNGGQLILCDESKLLDHKLLKEEINSRKVKKMWFTSGWFNQLVDADITLFENLETILVGGEKLSPQHIEKLRKTHPGIEVINGYGPTENTTFSLTYRIIEKEISAAIPIGRPLNNRSAFILDERHQLVPIGVGGEICLGGDGLSKGYLNRPELTSEKFIDNPYCEGRMYKTGDIGRWLPDGSIEYLGRKDDQVKIRGYRIEMGEIESVLRECEQVKDAAVITRTDHEDTKRLVAYIVPHDAFDKPAIQFYLKSKLPDYMIPALIVEMETLPLNANGKVDRKALPDPEITEKDGDQYAAPKNEDEKILARIWEELLDLERVSVDDNFFEIGGDSLLAIRVVSVIRKELGVEVPISNLFEYQTISTLAAKLKTQSNVAILPAIRQAVRPRHIPLSFSQERLWFIDRLEGSLQYHIPAVLRLKGDPNMRALEYALSSIVNRHEVLRTVFLEHDGNAYQSVKEKANWALPLVDGTGYKNDPPALQQLIQKLIGEPFDLSQDNMLRADVIKLNDDEHILVVTLHHIASDGWSRSILVKEVAELYAAFEEGREATLSDLPIQYADFSIWQRNYLSDEVLGKKMEYWQNKLEGIEPLQIPLDFPRPPVQTTRGASAPFIFDKQLSNALAQLSKEKGTTLFMTLLAALKVLLYRYSGQKDICVGTGVAGRQQQEVEGLIGFFINTLALRTELDTEASFTSLLQDVKRTTVEAYQNQEVPFEKVVDGVVRKRDRSRNPLFQVMFVLQNTPEIPNLKLGQLQLERATYEHTTSQFDLSFSITENDNGLSGSLEYNADLLSQQTVSRILENFKQLLGSIVKAPEQKISDLPILTAGEEHQLMEDFNDTHSAYPQDKSIADLFEEQAAKTPEANAVVFMEQILTYKQLDESSNQLANYLITKGIQPGDNVGLLSSRSLEMIIGIFGIIKTGAVYVPFNTDYPAERLQYIIDNADINHIVYADGELLKAYGFKNCDCIDINGYSGYQTQRKAVKVSIDSPVYIMYTSGTTGRPKGISVSNRNVIKLVYDSGDIAVNPDDRMLQWSNYAFDGCVYEIYSSLLKGAGLYLVKDEWASDVYELGRVIKEQKITMCFITTALFNTFIDVDPAMLKGLRKILFGGEMVSLSHVRKALQVIGQGKIVHVYGPTETTVYASFCPLNVIGVDCLIPIGKPLANTQLYILDAHLHLVPIGAFGELYIGGDGVSLGYVNNPGLTLEKFVNIPGIGKQKKLYRTGDMVRRFPDSNIVYIGRMDNQVKIRGYRIEPGEIENLLQESEMVSKAVVMVKENIDGNKSLVGYIVPNESYNKQMLVLWLHGKLPEYMMPAIWVEMASFPLNPNGKIDKKALPDPDFIEMLSDQYVEPSNEIERKLVNIWQEILKKERIGINENFFELGGHSLLAMRLIAAIRKELEVELAVKELFLNPTVQDLGSFLQKQRKVSLLPAIEAYPRPEHIPLSFSQERLWFVDQLEGSVQYNSPTVLRLKGELNKQALGYAVQSIIARHEVLRTVFYETEGKPYQAIIESEEWKLTEMEGSAYKDDRKALQNIIADLILQPFDLAKDYMLRAHLITLEKDDHVLVAVMHHIASDGWSVPIIVDEVAELYSAYVEQRSPVLAALPVQFADYAIWQRKYLGGEVFDNKIEYWKKKLDGVTALQLPTDFNRPSIRTLRGASFNFKIEKELSDELNQLSHQQGTTLYMVLLAAYKILLQRYSGQGDICVGASIANRPQQELEGLIGFFVNTLALRTWVDETTPFVEFLQNVKATTLEAYENQDVPFEKVVEEVVKERDPARSPLFQVMLVLLNTPESSKLGLGNVELSQEAFEIKISKFDFTFHVLQSENGLPVTVVYNTDLYREDTIARMAGHFKQLLNSVVKNPMESIELLSMLTEAEEQQLLMEFN